MTQSTVIDPERAANDSFRQFMLDIRQHPRLTPEQEHSLAMECAKGSQEAVKAMVSANLLLVVSVAQEYADRGVPLMDLIQEGSIGLIAAAKKFDYTRNTRFSTYATKWIRQGIVRCIVNNQGLIRVPHYTQERMQKVLRAKAELTQLQENEPTPEALAQRCDMDTQTVMDLLQLIPQVYSLDAPVGEDGEGALQLLLENVQSPQPQDALVRQELNRTMQTLMGLLTPRQQQVIRLRYGMENAEGWSTQQIAEKMNISRQRVRQIELEAMERLRKKGADFGLEDFLK